MKLNKHYIYYKRIFSTLNKRKRKYINISNCIFNRIFKKFHILNIHNEKQIKINNIFINTDTNTHIYIYTHTHTHTNTYTHSKDNIQTHKANTRKIKF